MSLAQTTSTTRSPSAPSTYGSERTSSEPVDHDQADQPPHLYRRDPHAFSAPVPRSAPIAIANAFGSSSDDHASFSWQRYDLQDSPRLSPRFSPSDSFTTEQEWLRAPRDASSDEEREERLAPQISDEPRSPRMDRTSRTSTDHAPRHDSMVLPQGRHHADVDAAMPSDTQQTQGLTPNAAAMVCAVARDDGVAIPAPSLAARLLRIRQDARVQRSPLPPGLWAVAQTVQAWEEFGLADRKVDVDEVIDPRWLNHHVAWFGRTRVMY